MGRLAVDGGIPIRKEMLPYGRHVVDERDIDAVSNALRGAFLTTGPTVAAFEQKFASLVGASHAVAVSSGTAALHAAVEACGIGPGDEVIVPAITFAATANVVVYCGATPIFADVDSESLLIDPASVASKVTASTKAVVAVDYAGQPSDPAALRRAIPSSVHVIGDACHALGASFSGRPVGDLCEVTAFSLHPVKHITTGEGGVITTRDASLASRMRRFRNHGISVDSHGRSRKGTWIYEIEELGYNYRITDFQCALGISQLDNLANWVDRRRFIASVYDEAFEAIPGVDPLLVAPDAKHAYHLYVVRIANDAFRGGRTRFFEALRGEGIGVNVHYIPVHLHPFYRRRLGLGPGLCPVAEAAYERIISLPIFPGMTSADINDVVDAVQKVAQNLSR